MPYAHPLFPSMPQSVRIVEVGPRDGLQNESQHISTAEKIEWIKLLVASGLRHIEVGSFVSKEWVPQMQDSEAVFAGLRDQDPNVRFSALVPNLKGLERALQAQAAEICIFASASETFSQHNTHCSIETALSKAEAIVAHCKPLGLPVRAYISCVFFCPYEGYISPEKVLPIITRLYQAGCYEISLGDTIGKATTLDVHRLLEAIFTKTAVPKSAIAVHFHNTYGQALANVYCSLQHGITTIDSSTAGLGGCPYAKGATGNLATEDLLFMLNGLQITTSVAMPSLLKASQFICNTLKRENQSLAARALLS